jgi:osmotically-inducible protein OsmY
MRKDNHIENKRAPVESRGAATSNEQRRENNKGKGPRSYQRSDNRILEQINERLCDNPYLDASDMEVAVENGVVFLTGTVSTRDEKRLAEEIAEEITGVENVENRLHITLRGI